jgi:hypothetical protein
LEIDGLVPGTNAAEIGKAEDEAHVSGNVGVMLLAVRADAAATTGSDDGDYVPLLTDANGKLWVYDSSLAGVVSGSELQVDIVTIATGDNNIGNVDVASISAGETHIGEVGGTGTFVDVVLSLDDGGAYASGDVLAATQEVASALRVAGGTGHIQTIVVQDDDDQAGALDLIFLDQNTSIGTENSAISMADNDDILGSVEVVAGDYVDMVNSQHATKTNVGIMISSATTSIWMAAASRDTKSYSTSGITVRLGIIWD